MSLFFLSGPTFVALEASLLSHQIFRRIIRLKPIRFFGQIYLGMILEIPIARLKQQIITNVITFGMYVASIHMLHSVQNNFHFCSLLWQIVNMLFRKSLVNWHRHFLETTKLLSPHSVLFNQSKILNCDAHLCPKTCGCLDYQVWSNVPNWYEAIVLNEIG